MKNRLIIIVIFIIIIYTNYVYHEENDKIKDHLKMAITNNKIKQHYQMLNIDRYINPNYTTIKNDSKIIYLTNFLNKSFFSILKEKCINLKSFRSNILNRKGGGISKFNLTKYYLNDGLVEPLNLYYSNELINFISELLNININVTNPTDATSCSLIIYDKPNDYIGWHNDYNAYYGNRWTVLITLLNTSSNNELSSSNFCYKDNKDICLKTEENSIVIFNGSKIKHIATPIKENEKRVVLALTFCDGCILKFDIVNKFIEHIKEFIFYGFSN